MTSRGKLMVALAVNRPVKNDTPSESSELSDPADDSDFDPDYIPESKVRKLHNYFTSEDLLTEINDYPHLTCADSQSQESLLFDEDVIMIGEEEYFYDNDKETFSFISTLLLKIVDSAIETSLSNNKKLIITSLVEISKDKIITSIIDERGYLSVSETKPNPIQNDDVEFIIQILSGIVDAVFVHVSSKKRNRKQARTEKSKIEKNLKIRTILPPCNVRCRRKCRNKFTETTRKNILQLFWSYNFSQRRLFLDSHIKTEFVKIRGTNVKDPQKRSCSYKYTLPQIEEASKNDITVCKTMFLQTLGMKTDGLITSHFKSKTELNGKVKITDERGKISREISQNKKIELDKKIKEHINSYNPVVSHYKFIHAPKRRYLPCYITIASLWKDFCSHIKVSYEKYRSVFDSMNIGFDIPSQDDCNTCSVYENHKTVNNEDVANHEEFDCQICQNFQLHKERYICARKDYEKDKEFKWPPEYNVFTVDMQRVLLIPKMTIKNHFFISKLVVFNETFASLHDVKNLCLLWNEAIQGRNCPDVTSTYYYIIRNAKPEVMHFIFWADNCSAQNKNWTLYSSMVNIVNTPWGPSKITFKYFEPGHSFMKADSVHGQIGTEMKRRSNILDMNDMVDVVKKSSKNNVPIVLHHSDFISFKDGSKARRILTSGETNIPLLENVRVAEFRKESKSLFFKKSFNEQDFHESQFLKNKFKLQIPEVLKNNRGINTAKKARIISELCKHMPLRKQQFWRELPTNDQVTDLCFQSATE